MSFKLIIITITLLFNSVNLSASVSERIELINRWQSHTKLVPYDHTLNEIEAPLVMHYYFEGHLHYIKGKFFWLTDDAKNFKISQVRNGILIFKSVDHDDVPFIKIHSNNDTTKNLNVDMTMEQALSDRPVQYKETQIFKGKVYLVFKLL